DGAAGAGRPTAGGVDIQDGNPSDADAALAEWAQRVTQAAETAHAYGRLPQGCERFIDRATKPRVDWRAMLRRFVQAHVRTDYTWSTPNKRYLAQGYYLPDCRSEQIGLIA